MSLPPRSRAHVPSPSELPGLLRCLWVSLLLWRSRLTLSLWATCLFPPGGFKAFSLRCSVLQFCYKLGVDPIHSLLLDLCCTACACGACLFPPFRNVLDDSYSHTAFSSFLVILSGISD